MRRSWIVGTLLAASLLAGLLVAPAAPAAGAGGDTRGLEAKYGIKVREHIVPTKFGKIYVRVASPVDSKGKIVRGPGIFTYSPYWSLGFDGANFRRSSGEDRWVPLGYHRIWADVVGTGNSGGCYDYGGRREKVTGAAVVEWIAKQKWSTGKVGMIGGSYEGTTATAAAVMNPKGLTTIVPEAAISRWYGYAYSGGIRYFLNNEKPGDEGFDTPAAFDFGLQVPPPLDPQNAGWQERFLDNARPCDEIQHTERGYDDTPDYGKFWFERDYLKDADNIDIPVLVAHNWGDWNVKQEEGWNLFRALDNSPKKVMYFGTRYSGHGTPDGSYDKFVDAWFAHYLMGVDNGIEDSPTIVSQTSDSAGALNFLSSDRVRTREVELIAQDTNRVSGEYRWKLLPEEPRVASLDSPGVMDFFSTGAQTEFYANVHGRDGDTSARFETPILARDVRIFGTPKVKIWSTIDREWVTYTPTLVDVDPERLASVAGEPYADDPSQLMSVTRGWLDSRYRNGLGKQVPVKPGKSFGMTVVMKPQDYVFRKGHYIALNIQTEINEWSLPKPYPCSSARCPIVQIDWEKGQTRLTLPVVDGPRNPADLFVTSPSE